MHVRGGHRDSCFRPISGAGSRCAAGAGVLPRSSPGCRQPPPQGVQAESGPRLAASGKHLVQQVQTQRCRSGANPGCVSTGAADRRLAGRHPTRSAAAPVPLGAG